jgi:excisionase family DNA binding protein
MTPSDDSAKKPKWFSIKEAAEYLEVGEPTLYRWMRDSRITYRKVGDSTRFLKEDLDAVTEVHHSAKDVEKVKEVCPLCRSDEWIEGHVQSTGLNYFRLKKTKFWTLKEGNVATHSRMCGNCGVIFWFGDIQKMKALHKKPVESKEAAPENPETPQPPE